MDQRRSTCPIANTLDEIGDRWTLLIIRDMLGGKHRFDEFLESDEKISTNILADRLKRLEQLCLITKEPYSSHPHRMQYELTERGYSLGPVLDAIVQWGLVNIEGTHI